MTAPLARKVQVWIHRQEPSQQVLIFRTTPARGDFWQPVTGGVEPGETDEQAVLREAREESGMTFAVAPVDLEYSFEYDGRWGPARERAFALAWPECLPHGPTSAAMPIPVIDTSEHVEWRWVSADEALRLVKFASNHAALHGVLNRVWKITP